MAIRAALTAVFLTLVGCSLYPYYPLSPTVTLNQIDVSLIAIKPSSTNSALPPAANTVGQYTGQWKTATKEKFTGDWTYTATTVNYIPPSSSNDIGTLVCFDKRKTRQEMPQIRECEVKKAIDYANDAKAKYLKAQWQHSSIPEWGGLLLIPAAASAGALAVENVGAGAITGLGAGAAAAYGLGSYLHTPARETVYNTAAAGVQCMLNNMQPYTSITNEDLITLDRLLGYDSNSDAGLNNLIDAQKQLELEISNVEALGVQKNCDRSPGSMKIASLLLTAAKAANNSATKTIKVGAAFLRASWNAPITIEYTTNQINIAMNGVLTTKEAQLSDLAGNIKSLVGKEQAVAGLPAAQASAAEAQNKLASAAPQIASAIKFEHSALDAGALALASSHIKVIGRNLIQLDEPVIQPQFHLSEKAAPPKTQTSTLELHSPGLTIDELKHLLELEKLIFTVNTKVAGILSIIGSNTGTIDNSTCPILAKQASPSGVAPLEINPDGDIKVSAGSKATISITGGVDPYTRALFAQTVCTSVTATLKRNVIDVSASRETTPGFYPFFVGDGPTGRIFNVRVTTPAAADDSDSVAACRSGQAGYVQQETPVRLPAKLSCPAPFVLVPNPR